MYHAIVRANVRALFEALNRSDIDYVVAGLASRFEHIFRVTTPWAGCGTPSPRSGAGLSGCFACSRSSDFEIKHIAVSGWPWRTTVVVEWRDYATLADGGEYVNDGAHAIQLSWGKVVVLHAYLDTQVIIDAMRKMAAAGVEEALAPKIED